MVALKNQIHFGGIFLLTGLLFLAGCKPPGARALLEGKSLIENGHYAEAVSALRTATSLMATNAQAWNYLGIACHQARLLPDAESAYKQALKLDHDLTEAHFNLGCLLLEQNKLDAAKTEFNAVTLRRANSADGWLKLAETQSRLRDASGAEKSFNEAIRIAGQIPEAQNGLGLIALQRNHAAEAARIFSAILKSKPDYAPAILNLAIVQQTSLGDRQAALQTYRQYLALTPAPADAEDVRATMRALEQQLAPVSHPPVTNVIAQAKPAPNVAVAAMTPKPETQAEVPKTATPVQPVTTPPVERITMQPNVIKSSNVSTTLVATAEKQAPLLPVKPTQPAKKGFFERINPFHRKEETTTNSTPSPPPIQTVAKPQTPTPSKPVPQAPSIAFARYKYISPSKPNPGDRVSASVPFVKGSQAYQAGKFADAAKAYLQAVQLDPSYFNAHYYLGLSAGQAGNLGQSLLAYENALAIQPDSEDARYAFALALKKANYPLDAVNELETILSANSRDARAHLAAGGIFADQLKQFDKAREHYSKVLEVDPTNAQATAIRYWLVDHPAQ